MNSAGGVGVFVRPHQLAVTSTIACAAEFGGSLLPLSHIPPPRCCARHAETARAAMTESTLPPFGCALRRRCCARHTEIARAAGRGCASICLLINWLSASRAVIAHSTALPFGCALRRSACRTEKFCRSIIRVYNIVGNLSRGRKTLPFYIAKYIIIWAGLLEKRR